MALQHSIEVTVTVPRSVIVQLVHDAGLVINNVDRFNKTIETKSFKNALGRQFLDDFRELNNSDIDSAATVCDGLFDIATEEGDLKSALRSALD